MYHHNHNIRKSQSILYHVYCIVYIYYTSILVYYTLYPIF